MFARSSQIEYLIVGIKGTTKYNISISVSGELYLGLRLDAH